MHSQRTTQHKKTTDCQKQSWLSDGRNVWRGNICLLPQMYSFWWSKYFQNIWSEQTVAQGI